MKLPFLVVAVVGVVVLYHFVFVGGVGSVGVVGGVGVDDVAAGGVRLVSPSGLQR